MPRPLTLAASALIWTGVFLLGADRAESNCNIIPKFHHIICSVFGCVNRPWAGAGETLEIRFPGEAEIAQSDDWIVSVRGGAGFSDEVVLANDCSVLSSCSEAVACVDGPTQLSVVERTNSSLQTEDRLEIRMPDLPPGPAQIVVRAVGDVSALCGAKVESCLTMSKGDDAPAACIQELYDLHEGGAEVPGRRNPIFPSLTILPSPNDFGVLSCEGLGEGETCTPSVTDLRIAVDEFGNFLIPVTWTGVLEDEGFFTLPREVTATIRWPEAWPAGIPDSTFLRSFSATGAALAPFFEPQAGEVGADNVIVLNGLADAFYGIVRIGVQHGICVGGLQDGQRCETDWNCGAGECQSSCAQAPATLCEKDSQCNDLGPCGRLIPAKPSLTGEQVFTLADDAGDPGGDEMALAFSAEGYVDPQGTKSTPALMVRTESEELSNMDLDGDGDRVDWVVRLRSRDEWTLLDLDSGAIADCSAPDAPLKSGRAPTFVWDERGYRSPAIALSAPGATTFAMLESEAASQCDQRCELSPMGFNCAGDGDRLDSLLRVFWVDWSPDANAAAVASTNFAINPEPVIDGAPLAISGHNVYARISELDNLPRTVFTASPPGCGPASNNGHSTFPAISETGNHIAFSSASTVLTPPCAGGLSDVFVYTESPPGITVASVALGGGAANGNSSSPVAISADGSLVAYASQATNLIASDTNGWGDVFLSTADGAATTRVSEVLGVGGNGGSHSPAMSSDGEFVAFTSSATNLVAVDLNGATGDIFVWQATTGQISLVSQSTLGAATNLPSGNASISADGNCVAFDSDATNLVAGDDNGSADVFVRDRVLGTTILVSQGADGTVANGSSSNPAISKDCRFVAFQSDAGDLVSNDDNEEQDVFVRDLELSLTTRVSVPSSFGLEADGNSFGAAISADGRMVAFTSWASNLTPLDLNTTLNIFIHDRVTRVTDLVSRSTDGTSPEESSGNGNSHGASISASGNAVAFHSLSSNILGSDALYQDVFVWSQPDFDTKYDVALDGAADGLMTDDLLIKLNSSAGSMNLRVLDRVEVASVMGGGIAWIDEDGILKYESGASIEQISNGPWEEVYLSGFWLAAVEPTVAGAATLGLWERVAESGPGGFFARPTMEILEAGGVQLEDEVLVASRKPTPACDIYGGGGLGVPFATRVPPWGDQDWSPMDENIGCPFTSVDFVLGSLQHCPGEGTTQFLAFRKWDGEIGVLEVDEPNDQRTILSGYRATPCTYPACNPDEPYQFNGTKLVFLVDEKDQVPEVSLNADADTDDILLVEWDVCNVKFEEFAEPVVIAEIDPTAAETYNPLDVSSETTVLQGEYGLCVQDPASACDPMNDSCAAGSQCHSEFYACVSTSADACLPAVNPADDECPSGFVCQPASLTVGIPVTDSDGDGFADVDDVCPGVWDPAQDDADGDGVGDACDGLSGACSEAPQPDCKTAGKSKLLLKDQDKDSKDLMTWVWSKGQALDDTDLGDPENTDEMYACVYGAGSLVTQLSIPAGGDCPKRNKPTAESPCWTTLGPEQAPKGLRYKSKGTVAEGAPDGVVGLLLKTGDEGKPKVKLTAKGGRLALPALNALPSSLKVQLQSAAGTCLESEFGPEDLVRQDAGLFKAVSR